MKPKFKHLFPVILGLAPIATLTTISCANSTSIKGSKNLTIKKVGSLLANSSIVQKDLLITEKSNLSLPERVGEVTQIVMQDLATILKNKKYNDQEIIAISAMLKSQKSHWNLKINPDQETNSKLLQGFKIFLLTIDFDNNDAKISLPITYYESMQKDELLDARKRQEKNDFLKKLQTLILSKDGVFKIDILKTATHVQLTDLHDLSLIARAPKASQKSKNALLQAKQKLIKLIAEDIVNVQKKRLNKIEGYEISYHAPSIKTAKATPQINVTIDQIKIANALEASINSYDFTKLKVSKSKHDEIYEFEVDLNKLRGFITFQYTDIKGDTSNPIVLNLDNKQSVTKVSLVLNESRAYIFDRVNKYISQELTKPLQITIHNYEKATIYKAYIEKIKMLLGTISQNYYAGDDHVYELFYNLKIKQAVVKITSKTSTDEIYATILKLEANTTVKQYDQLIKLIEGKTTVFNIKGQFGALIHKSANLFEQHLNSVTALEFTIKPDPIIFTKIWRNYLLYKVASETSYYIIDLKKGENIKLQQTNALVMKNIHFRFTSANEYQIAYTVNDAQEGWRIIVKHHGKLHNYYGLRVSAKMLIYSANGTDNKYDYIIWDLNQNQALHVLKNQTYKMDIIAFKYNKATSDFFISFKINQEPKLIYIKDNVPHQISKMQMHEQNFAELFWIKDQAGKYHYKLFRTTNEKSYDLSLATNYFGAGLAKTIPIITFGDKNNQTFVISWTEKTTKHVIIYDGKTIQHTTGF